MSKPESQNQTGKLRRAANGELWRRIEKALREVYELTPERERREVMQRFDRNLATVRDLQHDRPRRLPKLLHSDECRVHSGDTVSRKGRLLAFSEVC